MAKYCVLAAAGDENDNANFNNINFTFKDTKLYVPVVTLSAKENEKLSKLFSKGFERSVYWNEYKTRSENKNVTNEYRYFLEPNFVGFNPLFVLFYSKQDVNAKRYKARRYYLPKVLLRIIMLSSWKELLRPTH